MTPPCKIQQGPFWPPSRDMNTNSCCSCAGMYWPRAAPTHPHTGAAPTHSALRKATGKYRATGPGATHTCTLCHSVQQALHRELEHVPTTPVCSQSQHIRCNSHFLCKETLMYKTGSRLCKKHLHVSKRRESIAMASIKSLFPCNKVPVSHLSQQGVSRGWDALQTPQLLGY